MRSLLFALACTLSLVDVAVAGGVDQLQAFLANTQTARGVFSQSVLGESGRTPRLSGGAFVLQRPGKLRWIYQRPYNLLLVVNDEKLWSYDSDLNQATVSSIDQSLGATPAALLAGDSLERHFRLTDIGAIDGIEYVEATPTDPDSAFTMVRIGFVDQLPQRMEVRDNFGQNSVLTFSSFEANPVLPADAFLFAPPPGADIIGEGTPRQ